jgi:hypothetical protein
MEFSFSVNVQNLSVNSHGRLMCFATIWDFRGTKWRASMGCRSPKRKSVTSMELERRHVINVLQVKGLKLLEIAKALSNAYGRDAYAIRA